jgi:hypothetical protein
LGFISFLRIKKGIGSRLPVVSDNRPVGQVDGPGHLHIDHHRQSHSGENHGCGLNWKMQSLLYRSSQSHGIPGDNQGHRFIAGYGRLRGKVTLFTFDLILKRGLDWARERRRTSWKQRMEGSPHQGAGRRAAVPASLPVPQKADPLYFGLSERGKR